MDPKSPNNTVKASVFYALLGSALIKAAHEMLMKATSDPKSAKRH